MVQGLNEVWSCAKLKSNLILSLDPKSKNADKLGELMKKRTQILLSSFTFTSFLCLTTCEFCGITAPLQFSHFSKGFI